LDKKEWIGRQLAKTNKKNWENYVITRIIHRVDDLEVKYVTQQYVKRPKGHALTDLYLPQVGLQVEVDEGQHKAAIEADMIRESDIVSATSNDFERIDVTGTLESINARTGQVVDEILRRLAKARESGTWTSWDPEISTDPKTYVEAGFMDASEDVAFYRHIDVIECFGRKYKGFQRALAQHPRVPDQHIWFPKLYENADWDNSISDDEMTIYERRKKNNRGFVSEHLRTPEKHKRLVFARVRSPLGDVMYRFKGLFEADVDRTKETGTVTYQRNATRVPTYETII
jgi:very-short-patch-repair endonuclease